MPLSPAELSTAALCRAIAQLQFAAISETAGLAYHRPADKDGTRAKELAKLRSSSSILDRYAALLVDRWDRADAEDRRR